MSRLSRKQAARRSGSQRAWRWSRRTSTFAGYAEIRKAYAHAIASDPTFIDAHINLGRLLHDAKRFARAERVYRDAIDACGHDPVLLYNLGVLLDDLNRAPEALMAYEAALRGDPDLADCHYNLSLLYEKFAQPKHAIRHMARYRMLVGKPSK